MSNGSEYSSSGRKDLSGTHMNAVANGGNGSALSGGGAPYDARALQQQQPQSSTGRGRGVGPGSRNAIARQQQRRRPTNYTSSYTPPASLVAHAARAREGQNDASLPSGVSSSRRKCSSLDRSEEDGDERRRHLNGGSPGENDQNLQQQHPQRRSSHHDQKLQLQEMQRQLQQQRQSLEEQQLQEKMYFSRQQQKQLLQQQQQQQGGSDNHRSGTSPPGGRSRRASQEHTRGDASSRRSSQSSRHSQSSRSNARRHSGGGNDDSETKRIEEYAGKRALLRLEQELADHSESQLRNGRGDPHSNGNGEQIRSVMDRKKLARVPQVKKSDLIIGEYLGRGNFCDVFEVTWILPEQKNRLSAMQGGGAATQWSSNRTLSTHGSGGDSESDLEASMDSLALTRSNDLSLIPQGGSGRRGSRRSVSQIRTSFTAPGGVAANLTGEGHHLGGSFRNGGLRNPNVLALKCLRPAVRAQPRKFVIGAEDLAHETALLACLDHPNIIQLYGRAEGCFSTAFQMRSKNSSGSSGSSKDSSSKGKQMSNEGYFIILDRLMTTLTDRIDEWKDECRSINGVGPPGGSGHVSKPVQLPPESTLGEHLCKRLKVAYCIADALEYLHSRHVVFRDLKPANVGFDCNDCVKMFDFGFATSIAPLLKQPFEGYGPLTETCGTRRYMAPEVALKLGYGKEVDVYSFGMLLWEICAMDKPFDSIQSVDEFHDLVVLCGRRPSLNTDPLWTNSLKNLMCRCWSTDPLDRPNMGEVKALLCNVLRDLNKAMESRKNGANAGVPQQRQEQGGNFIHKWRRRVSI